MIRESIEPGTPVFHHVHGYGYFQKFNSDTKKKCTVIFDPDYPTICLSKDLTEVEE